MEIELTKSIAETLTRTGKKIQKSPEEHGVSLRNTVRSLQELSEGCDNPNVTYLSYFLGLFIDDVWCNIAMDATTQSEISDDNVRSILSSIGTEFVRLGNQISKEDYSQCYEVYVNLVNRYLKWILSIKEEMGAVV